MTENNYKIIFTIKTHLSVGMFVSWQIKKKIFPPRYAKSWSHEDQSNKTCFQLWQSLIPIVEIKSGISHKKHPFLGERRDFFYCIATSHLLCFKMLTVNYIMCELKCLNFLMWNQPFFFYEDTNKWCINRYTYFMVFLWEFLICWELQSGDCKH